jgi:hypothetical protein
METLSKSIEQIRLDLAEVRVRLNDLISKNNGWKDRLSHIEGLLICGLISLHSSKEEVIKWEIARDDKQFGAHYVFRPRGIGLDVCPCCFVCGSKKRAEGSNDYLNNIAAFVRSEEEGMEICQEFFGGRARLDYRIQEPNWTQVKVGACDKHLANLRLLENKTSQYGIIRAVDVREAIEL